MKLLITIFFLFTSLFADTLDTLLQEYDKNNEKSLKTVDEKLGHVFIYSQKDIQRMQYHNLNDILKELPLLNLNKNRFGTDSLAVAGSKTNISGFYRIFINDHEISSSYTQSASSSWGNLPLDFIDYLEIYYGESSFVSGNESGIYFIRFYTKKAVKENGSEINLKVSSKGSSSQGISDSKVFENGWSYLLYLNNDNQKNSTTYENNEIDNNTKRRYAYLDLSNDNTSINLAYTDLKKDTYTGLSTDASPEGGEIVSKDFYVDIIKYFLYDKSLKANISIDVNEMKYEEKNNEGITLIPSFGSVGDAFIPNQFKPKLIDEDLKFTKLKAGFSKSFESENNNFLAGINFTKKDYDTQRISLNDNSDIPQYTDFDEEQIISLLFQDDYKIRDDLVLIGNAKFDRYKRAGFLENINEEVYRIGAIYTPFENFGIKTFYTKSYIAPSFYNIDNALINKNLEVQDYKFYTVEAVYTIKKSKFGITYNNVKIDNFIHFDSTVGFLNLDDEVKTSGLIYSYDYIFSDENKIQINYYTTKLNQEINNSNDGGYIKYMGSYKKFEYFTSLIYRNSYSYNDVSVDSSYDVSLGTSYNVNKNLKFSLKANNIFDDSTQSLYTSTNGVFSLDDSSSSITASVKWLF
jgi:iron complex outermembrane receptor protein